MTVSVLQSVVARCRDNFSTASATVVLITGTRRRIVGLTAGSYLDIEGKANFAIGAAADAKMSIYLGATVAAMAAIGEAGVQSVVTAADTGCLSTRARYGPITAAQAASGVWVDLRIATSADTLSITATTTPTGFGSEMKVDEVSAVATSPASIENLLLWLKADSGVNYDGTTKLVSSWTPSGGAQVITYGSQTGNYAAGLILTGGTSGATGRISSDKDNGTSGKLVLTDVVGTFVSGELLTDSSTGSATATSAPAALTITAGAVAPTYEASALNSLPGVYFDYAKNAHLLFSDLPSQATAFQILAVLSIDAFVKAGASLLNPPTASSAACLRVCISNATVNRLALLRTSAPEYVSNGATTTSGKVIGRWRYNKGTTTGEASINGSAGTTDATFDETLVTWDSIGSRTAGTYALGGFRLMELIIYQLPQASTEDALANSDTVALLDYLNAKWLVF